MEYRIYKVESKISDKIIVIVASNPREVISLAFSDLSLSNVSNNKIINTKIPVLGCDKPMILFKNY